MKQLYWILFFCSLMSCQLLNAQVVGGRHAYDFLSLPNSARLSALGGSLISVQDADLSLAYQNPAALNPLMHQQIVLQQSVHPAGITDGYAAYGHYLESIPLTIHGGIQYISYGKFQRTNQIGDLEGGEFGASEMAITAGASYQATERLSFGSNLKVVMSYLEGYNSTGLASDWGIMYKDTAKRISVGFVLRNLGTQFNTYGRNGNFKPLPFDAQLAVSHRLKYLPLRFSVIGHQLHRWNVRYDDPALAQNNLLITTEDEVTSGPTAGEVVDNIFRHLKFNLELLLGKNENFQIRVGYDRMRQGELGVSGLRTLAGFSAGVGLKVYKFRIDYGLMAYHIAGTRHHFGISTNLSEF
jgi:hypothetical protein